MTARSLTAAIAAAAKFSDKCAHFDAVKPKRVIGIVRTGIVLALWRVLA